MTGARATLAPAAVRSDRAAGAVLASACGDALGAGYEFGPALAPGTPVAMTGGGTFGWAPGEWTDDTQMALAVLVPLAQGAADDGTVDRIEAGFRAWFAGRPADVGTQTRAVLSRPGPLARAAADHTATHAHAAGNGSLMRTGPVALAHPGDPGAVADLARRVSELTHPDPDCVDACVLWSVAIDDTIRHAPASDEPWAFQGALIRALPLLADDTRRARWRALIEAAADGRPEDFARNGWVVHAFQAALSAICSTPVPPGPRAAEHLRLALERAVRAGQDTDTVAAIAGSLLGARWGATAVPFRWRRLVHGRQVYDRPALRVGDLERLARLALRGGRPDAAGWPSTPSMVAYYADSWRDTPRRVTLGGVGFGNVAGLADAIAAGADIVVSLCRMGTDEVPDGVEHHVLGLLDTDDADNPNLAFLLADTADAVAALVDEGRRPYVHCVQAHNRTPVVAAAFLCRRRGMTPDEALAVVARELRRPDEFLASAVRTGALL